MSWQQITWTQNLPDWTIQEIGNQYYTNRRKHILEQWGKDFSTPVVEQLAAAHPLQGQPVTIQPALDHNNLLRRRQLSVDYLSDNQHARLGKKFDDFEAAIRASRFSISAQELLDVVTRDLGETPSYEAYESDYFAKFAWYARQNILQFLTDRSAFTDGTRWFDYQESSDMVQPLNRDVVFCEAEVSNIIGEAYVKAYEMTPEARTILSTLKQNIFDLFTFTDGDKHRLQRAYPRNTGDIAGI